MRPEALYCSSDFRAQSLAWIRSITVLRDYLASSQSLVQPKSVMVLLRPGNSIAKEGLVPEKETSVEGWVVASSCLP